MDIMNYLNLLIMVIMGSLHLQEIEDAEHYLFRCRRFINQRLSLFHKTRHLHPLNTNLLLSGNLNISYNDNVLLFEAVQKYIKDTARFDT